MVNAAVQKNLKIQATAYGSMGNIYYARGEYLKAMDVYIKDLKLLEMTGDKDAIGSVTGNLGLVYSEIGNYKKAMEHQLNSLKIRTELHDTVGMAQTYGNIGTLYYAEGDKRKCLEYMTLSYNMHKLKHNKQGMGITLGNIGEIYQELGNLDSAYTYMQRGLAMKEEVQDNIGIVSSYQGLGDIKISKGQWEEGKKFLLKAKSMAEQLDAKPELSKIYQKLTKAYEHEKDYEKAFNAFTTYTQIKDSLYNSDKIAEVNKKEIQFEFDKKEAATASELEKQKLLRNGFIVGGLLLLGFTFVVYRNFSNKKKANILLQHQKHIIEEKQKEILDSIQYAEQIQKTLIANHDFVNQTIPDSFVVFKPKDIVSGDFYWATSVQSSAIRQPQDNELGVRSSVGHPELSTSNSELRTNDSELFYLAVCDSTGHGVPGAFMSLLNISFLNEAINEKHIHDPSKVLEHVRTRLVNSISQSGRKDGMDAILVCFDKNSGKITYSAANNQPLLVSKNKVVPLTYDKMPVGKGEKTDDFKTYNIPFSKGDMLYLYTDGYADQFGGPKGKKFKYKQLEEFLLHIHDQPVEKQREQLSMKFEEWRGKLEQIDDVCIVGVRL
jgi:serine phosphatase RsbU (regulator of sigma subunit)